MRTGGVMTTVVYLPAPVPDRVIWERGDHGPFRWSLCPKCGRLADDLRHRIYFPPDPKNTCPTEGCPGAGGVVVVSETQARRLRGLAPAETTEQTAMFA
jgi:hypothetical protein